MMSFLDAEQGTASQTFHDELRQQQINQSPQFRARQLHTP